MNIIEAILEYSGRIINNITFRKMRKFQNEMLQFVNLFKYFSTYCLQIKALNIKDQHIPKLLNIWRRISKQISDV